MLSQIFEELRGQKKLIALKLRTYEFAPVCIITINEKGHVVDCNLEFEKVFGYSCEEMEGDNLLKIIPLDLRLQHLQGIKRLQTTGRSKILGKAVQMRGLRKGGMEFPIELCISEGWEYSGETYYTAYLKEIKI